ncbi:MAG: filamentous hemagglutinin N-terminal domain-containing protein [Nostoc sp.]|uniref:two-partner secretion domain-containing protein n=1 Tax=Nostoc sp. TaxID=1180 RepID=UPI002FFD5630
MKQLPRQILITSSAYICCLIASSPVLGQISSDNTLPDGQTVVSPGTKPGQDFLITGGTKVGSNLFHSFREFSVPTGGEAFFSNTAAFSNISNIISRVTGGSISNIDGLIRENYGANFILINPSGINFGANAQLNIGGSFLASTANSLKFADGAEFSATDSTSSPRLTISVPVGLQFGQNPQAIRVQGQGHNISLQSAIFSPFTRGDTAGLEVQPGNTLALVGGGIISEGGTLKAEGGRIDLGSVVGGFVSLNPSPQGWNLGYQGVTNFQDIALSQKALVDTSGAGIGSIQLQGRNISIRDGSVVLIQTQGAQSAGGINVNASESLSLVGTTTDGQISSNLFAETIGGGKSGDITVKTPRLVIQDGAAISAATYTAAPGGNIDIKAGDFLQVSGFSPFNPSRFSNITAGAFGAGNAGSLTISTQQLTALSGGNIASVTAGTGSGGNVTVNASKLVELIGVTPLVFTPSQITAGTGGPGKAGSVTINTQRLVIKDGGRVDASTLASGAAGSITINAKDAVEVSGTVPNSINPSLIIASGNIVDSTLQQLLRLPPIPSGASGDVTINTGTLSITDGALVTATNSGSGISGNVRVNASFVFLDSGGGITSELGGDFTGGKIFIFSPITVGGVKGGDITISTQKLTVQGGANLSTATFTNAAGGNITVDASDSTQVIGFAPFSPNALSSISASTFGSGNSGNVTISTGQLKVLNGARVGAGTFRTGSGGDVTINSTDSVQVIGAELSQAVGSLIGVSTLNRGNAGNLTINTPRLVVRDGGRIDSSTAATGSAGSVTINAPNSVEVSGTISGTAIPSLISSGANIETEIVRQLFRLPPVPSGSSGDATINTGKLTVTNGAQVTTTNQGSGNAGSVRVNARSTFLDEGGGITTATASGEGGNIFLRTNSLLMRNGSQISAEAGGTGNGGNITITGYSPADFVALLEGSKITADAVEGMGGNISINTKGFFVCPTCQISASSQLGIAGQISIIAPEAESNFEVIDLPQEVAKPEQVVAQACRATTSQNRSEFTITGRGGLPPRPSEQLSSGALISFESADAATEVNNTSQLPPPARGWYVNAQGVLVLASQTPNATPYSSGLSSSNNCH